MRTISVLIFFQFLLVERGVELHPAARGDHNGHGDPVRQSKSEADPEGIIVVQGGELRVLEPQHESGEYTRHNRVQEHEETKGAGQIKEAQSCAEDLVVLAALDEGAGE